MVDFPAPIGPTRKILPAIKCLTLKPKYYKKAGSQDPAFDFHL
jgi:hypothetical protein